MNEIITKIKEKRGDEAFGSAERFTEAARELGASESEIAEAVLEIGGFPLSDDELESAAGGLAARTPSARFNDGRKCAVFEVRCSRCKNHITVNGVTYDRTFANGGMDINYYRDEVKNAVERNLLSQRCPLGGVCDPLIVKKN